MTEKIVIALIIGAAVLLAARFLYRTLTGKGEGCTSCPGCGGGSDTETTCSGTALRDPDAAKDSTAT